MLRSTGTYALSSTAGARVKAFLPHPLPPVPPLQLEVSDQDLLEQANRALGRLDGMARLLPEVQLFVYTYVRKEAVLSSQIEGTQSERLSSKASRQVLRCSAARPDRGGVGGVGPLFPAGGPRHLE